LSGEVPLGARLLEQTDRDGRVRVREGDHAAIRRVERELLLFEAVMCSASAIIDCAVALRSSSRSVMDVLHVGCWSRWLPA
jgi:hypothetical protein